MNDNKLINRTEAHRRLKVSLDSLDMYEEQGIIKPVKIIPSSGRRFYKEEDIVTLAEEIAVEASQYLTPRQAAEVLNIGIGVLWRMVSKGIIKSHQLPWCRQRSLFLKEDVIEIRNSMYL